MVVAFECALRDGSATGRSVPIQAQDQVVRRLNSSAMPLDIALLRQGDGAVVLRGYANAAVTKGKLSFEYSDCAGWPRKSRPPWLRSLAIGL